LMTDVEYSEGIYRVVFKDNTVKDINLRSNQIKKDFKAVDVRSSESLDVYKVGAPQDGKIENLLEVDGVPLTKDNLRFVAEKKVEKVRLKNGKEFVLRTGDEIWVGDACYENGVKIMDYATEADKVTIKFDPKTGQPMLSQRKAWWRGEKVDNIFHQVHLRDGSYGKSAADYFLTRRFWVGGDVHINGSPRFIPGAPTIAGYGMQALPIYFAMKAPSGYERAREAAGGIGSTSMALGFSVIGGMVGDGPGIFIGGFMGGIYGDILGREALDQSLHYGRQNVSVPILQLPSN